jgi:3'(2'), 5'-bisphosphate nucleotidase
LGLPNIAHDKLKQLIMDGAQMALKAQKDGSWERTLKSDSTPVTTLDLELHELLNTELPKILDVPVVSEEGAWEKQEGLSTFWCVDPLDGTKHFIQGSRDFALCVALVWDGYPILGALAGPAWGQFFYAYQGKLEINGKVQSPLKAPAPRERVALISTEPSERLTDLFFHLGIEKHQKRGSVIKLAHLAEGQGHFYPRFGITREWDRAGRA